MVESISMFCAENAPKDVINSSIMGLPVLQVSLNSQSQDKKMYLLIYFCFINVGNYTYVINIY